MESVGVSTLQTNTECKAYLQELSSEQFLSNIALVASYARGYSVEENNLTGSERIVVYANEADITLTDGIRYIPPHQNIGRESLATALDIAKSQPNLVCAGALLRLMIPLAHIQIEGNGAASRFYNHLLTNGYDGTPSADKRYQALLASQGRPKNGYKEIELHCAFAEYYSTVIGDQNNLPFTPAGYTEINWQKDQISKFPSIEHGEGMYFVEDNFATAMDIDFILETGRDVRDYAVKVRKLLRSHRYIDTGKLLNDVSVEESLLAAAIGDRHKAAYLSAVNDYFYTGSHPAFRKLDVMS